MKRLCSGVVVAALALAAGPARAGSFAFDAHFAQSDLEGLAEGIGDALTFPNLGTAAPTGLAGFEVLAAAGGPEVDTDSNWWHYVDASTAGGVLYGQRVIVRKGLPLNLDIGVQAGKVAGKSFQGGEVRWAILEGGSVSPAIALRATYSKLSTAPFECEVAEGQLFISKGFLVVSPYGGLGYRRVSARASFGEPVGAHSVDLNHGTVTVGARVTLFPFLHIVGEVRKSSKVSIFFGVGVGL
jgi:hypothetical protein